MISNWSWKLISIYRFWFLISKTNLQNWSKFLISSLQFDSAKILFFKIILIKLTNSIYWFSISKNSTWFTKTWINLIWFLFGERFKFLDLVSYSIRRFTQILNFRIEALNVNSFQKTRFSFFDDRERILLRISIIRGNGLPDRNTDFPFFCLPNWAIQSIDRNQQNSGSKTNFSRFLKAGLIFNYLFIRFLFPNEVRPTARLRAGWDSKINLFIRFHQY